MKSQPHSQHLYLGNSEWQEGKKVIVIVIVQRRAEEG